MPADWDAFTGLMDFDSYDQIVEALEAVLGLPREDIHRRLFAEAVTKGANVTEASKEFGVKPHVFDERMERFYASTDAFVFECLVGHLLPQSQEIDRRVIETVREFSPRRPSIKLLCLGDGIGSDSLRFAKMGYAVTYFDVGGASAALAAYRFEREGVDRQVEWARQVTDISVRDFDVVISREVLEHLPDPPSAIDSIRRYLVDDGIAIITESFHRVEPVYPTHLASNAKYSGMTEVLFLEAGFRLVKSFAGRRPMVFERAERSELGSVALFWARQRHRARFAMKRAMRGLRRVMARKTMLSS